MRSSDFLFRLIKALSKGDRRNFKLFARLQEGDKKYIQLFDAIDKQDAYDEKKLLKQFKGERFTKQFSVAKNYLYNYILRTLDIFQSDPHADLTSLIHKIEILIGKNLFDQAEKLLKKAKHIAARQERFGEMLELLGHERMILDKTRKVKEYHAFIGEIQAYELKTLDQQTNVLQYLHLYDEAYKISKRSISARNEEDAQAIKTILLDPVLKKENALSTRAEIIRLGILNISYRYQHNFKKCLEISQELIQTYENHPHILKEKNDSYFSALRNYGIILYQIGNTEEALDILRKLKEAKAFNEQEKIRVFEDYYIFKIGACIENADILEGIKAIKELEKQLPIYQPKLMKANELMLYYFVSYFYFFSGRSQEAVSWINKILNEPKTELRMDIQCMARVLNLLVHYELGNKDLLDYNMKSVYRFIANRERLFKFEKTILKYLRALNNIHPDEDKNEILSEFGKSLDQVLQDPFEKKALNLLDASRWIQGKLTGQTISDIILLDQIEKIKQS